VKDYSDAELKLLLRYANGTYRSMLGATTQLRTVIEAKEKSGRSTKLGDLQSLGGLRERQLGGCRPVRLRGREHAPHGAQHHEEMRQCVGVDDEAFADGAEEGGEDRKIGALPGARA